MSKPKPCLLERIVQSKVWGGRSLQQLFGIASPDGEPVGETWELFDRPEGSSGLQGGGTLRDLMAEHAEEVLGRGVRAGHGGRFPLLFKFLDAQTPLSVQVHPDDEMAAPLDDGGKTEAWLVLGVSDDARIIRGFRPGVTVDQLAAAVRSPEVESLLHAFTPEVGDCIYVPPGTVHAIGPGVVIFEVQQNSDITWRLYDWGRNRTLHVDQGLAAAHVTDGTRDQTVPPRRLRDGGTMLVETPFFRMRRYRLGKKTTMPTDGAFLVVTVLGGRGVLGWHSGGDDAPLRLQPGDCALVPACCKEVFLSPIGDIDVVVTDPGRR